MHGYFLSYILMLLYAVMHFFYFGGVNKGLKGFQAHFSCHVSEDVVFNTNVLYMNR